MCPIVRADRRWQDGGRQFAVHLALAAGGKCFTTPAALSGQKRTDLTARYGVTRIRAATGDLSVNGNAPVVVMTTEVLRNTPSTRIRLRCRGFPMW